MIIWKKNNHGRLEPVLKEQSSVNHMASLQSLNKHCTIFAWKWILETSISNPVFGWAGLTVVQLEMHPTGVQEVTVWNFDPNWVQQHSFVETDHEKFATVILSLLQIQERQLSVSGKRMCTNTWLED